MNVGALKRIVVHLDVCVAEWMIAQDELDMATSAIEDARTEKIVNATLRRGVEPV